MASIGSEDEWNILHDTHTKLVYYCWEPLTIEYPGKFFYPPLTFLIKKRKLCSQYFHNTFTINSIGKLLLIVIGGKKKKKVILVGV